MSGPCLIVSSGKRNGIILLLSSSINAHTYISLYLLGANVTSLNEFPIYSHCFSAFLVLNTLRKMYKTEFCLNNHTNGRNTNLINMSRTNAINGDIATFADNAPLNTFLRRRYEITNGTASGAPDAQDGYVEIHKTVSNDWIVIYAITNRGTVYTRAKTEGVWGAWTNCNDKLGVSIQRLEYRWDNQNPKLIVTDPNGYSAYVSLTKYQG